MYIEKVIISNFRIYYGTNPIQFTPDGARNISIVAGDNGYGKTTFLTASVWCFYGKLMQEVDKSYKEGVLAAGGYGKYLLDSMNRLAKLEGQNEFYVSIRLKEVKLPGVPCNSIEVKRTFSFDGGTELLDVRIDDSHSELVEEMGQQTFIQDFILPREIAKFFFFDSERIVDLGEMGSISERRSLSQAYSEVLGIKKYEELRSNLNNLRISFRKDSASANEKIQFENLSKEIQRLTKSAKYKEARKEKLASEKSQLRHKSDELQEQLVREGSYLTLADIDALHQEKLTLHEKEKDLITEFRELVEYAPFAIMGKLLPAVKSQLDAEEKIHRSMMAKDLIEDKIKKMIQELKITMDETPLGINDELKLDFIAKVDKLLNKYFIVGNGELITREIKILHDFTSQQKNDFDTVFSSLKTSCGNRLSTVSKSLKNIRLDSSNVNRKLAQAESGEANALVRNYRLEKENIDRSIQASEEEALSLSQAIGYLRNELASKMVLYEELASKIRVSKKYKDKDQLITRLISELDDFLRRFKEEKKHSLESGILANLNTLMHKENFIQEVAVEIVNDLIEIRFFDGSGYEIRKDNLSKGEQQLYATALLKALVEESGMDFPVFIDSPLQKFDDKHTQSVITSFYPNISRQVVLFPLPNKELGEEEYRLLVDNIESTYVIRNHQENASIIEGIDPRILFAKSTNKYKAAEYV